MRIAHIADCHLAFRQFQRLAPDGVNRRMTDVSETFGRMIDGVIRERPDLVVIAGDLFHVPRPANQVVIFAFEQFSKLRQALKGVPVIIVGGNHDCAPTTDTASLLPLFAALPDFHVAAYKARSVRLGDVNVRMVPERAGPTEIGAPDATARLNVLVFHGELSLMPHAHAPLTVEQLGGWSVVCAGHYHECQWCGFIGYSGSLDYTSSNPWDETTPKGWCLIDTEARTVTRVLTNPRPHVALPVLSHHGVSTPALVQSCIDALSTIPQGAVVRQVIEDASIDEKHALEAAMRRADTSRALAYQLDVKKPQQTREVRSTLRRQSLDDMLMAKLRERLADAQDLSESDLIALNRQYLERAEDMMAQYTDVDPAKAA